MRAVFITEGKKDIGFGHVTRCMGIAKAFEEKNIKTLLIINGDKSILNLFEKENYQIIDWIKDGDKLSKIIKKDDIVFIDSYLANINFYKKISKLVKQVVYIDDNNRLSYPKGIVLNGNIYAASLPYQNKKDLICLLGPKYAPIRKEFWESPVKKINKKVKNVLITFGGDDKRDLTPKVLSLIQENYPDKNITVIIGNGFANKFKLKKSENKKTKLIIDPSPIQLKNLMIKTDLAISASGQTTLELLRLRIPTIIIVVANNQVNIARELTKKNLVEYVGDWKDKLLLNKLSNKIQKLQNYKFRKIMSNFQKNLIDGQGARRIVSFLVKKLENISQDGEIFIRKAKLVDCIYILNISNQKDIRKNSFNSETIEIEDHKKWFLNKIYDKNLLFFIAEVNKKIAGQIRAELLKDKAVVSIGVSEEYRKMKIGYSLMVFLLNYLKLNKKRIKLIIVKIKPKNVDSINFFKSLSFRYSKKIIVKGEKAVVYTYKI